MSDEKELLWNNQNERRRLNVEEKEIKELAVLISSIAYKASDVEMATKIIKSGYRRPAQDNHGGEVVWPEEVIHKHDSIPCFTGMEKEGCVICIRNRAIADCKRADEREALSEKVIELLAKELHRWHQDGKPVRHRIVWDDSIINKRHYLDEARTILSTFRAEGRLENQDIDKPIR